MEKKNPPHYDERKRSKASITAVLRSIVAFYLAYLGWTIAQGSGGPDTTMESWLGWTICAVFTAVGIAFGVYTLRRYQIDLKEAQLGPRDSSPETGEEREEQGQLPPERNNHED